MELGKFKYEVAFSFLQRDELIAFQINDLLQDRLETFIYSKKQEELGGTDGEKKFNEVFFKETRLVVLLYRDGWGRTSWTRIEETAIKNRAFETGWDFLLIVNLDKNSTLPSWIPKTYIWFDFERWKAEGVAPVIEQKIREIGGRIRQDSIEDKAKRFGRLRATLKERDRFLKGGDGIEAANSEVIKIIELLKESKEQLEDPSTYFHFTTKERSNQMFQFGNDGYYLSFNALNGFEYDLQEGKLLVTIFERYGHYGLNEEIRIIEETTYKFDRDLVENNIWTDESKIYTTKELVHYWVSEFIKILEQKEKDKI